ncbi:MAG TPA: nucleotide exchange factor GrpE [Thermoanaerobaculia bacterium]|nr:nucleotide exchange factor GrpE [Thermoanaerobaculia bacterium]
MTDKKTEVEEEAGNFDTDDDSYILEDTGESLSDFDPNAVQENAGTQDDLEILRAENSKLRDQNIRKLAEFENFRKRTEREKNEYFRYALADIMKDLLPVVDNFDRALESIDERDSDIREGVELIHKQFRDVLKKYGLSAIDESGVAFDPQIHEAVIREENPEVPSHTVEILQKGYDLNDRLLRPAMVKVVVGGPESSTDDLPEED